MAEFYLLNNPIWYVGKIAMPNMLKNYCVILTASSLIDRNEVQCLNS